MCLQSVCMCDVFCMYFRCMLYVLYISHRMCLYRCDQQLFVQKIQAYTCNTGNKNWGCPADLLTYQTVLNPKVHGHTSRAPPIGIEPMSPPTQAVALPTKSQIPTGNTIHTQTRNTNNIHSTYNINQYGCLCMYVYICLCIMY